MQLQELTDLVIQATKELAEADGLDLPEAISAETALFGANGILDSMGLVSLVIAVEQAVEEQCGTTISLANEKALSQQRSPYRTIAALAEYAIGEIEASRENA